MTTAEELRAIADSVQVVLPFQGARLHVLAARVDDLDHGNATHRAAITGAATAVRKPAQT